MKSLQINFNGKPITISAGTVTFPSGLTLKLNKALGLLASLQTAGPVVVPKYADDRLSRLGLTPRDIQAVQTGTDLVARQLLSTKGTLVRCRRCQRILWNADSIRRGVGPVCLNKL